jgi:hypothetical protein
MLLFIKRYMLSLIALLLTMSVYRVAVVPFIEPPQRVQAPVPDFPGALGGPQWWQALFPSGAWQVDNPRIIQSKRGAVLLSRNYVQTGPRTLSLKPLTIVLPQSSTDQTEQGIHDVLIISAEQGAEIHFEEDFDPSGSIPSVERGELRGIIEVTRQYHGQPDSASWSLRTSDLSLNRTQISTPQAVTIRWPDGIIEGHDMRLSLQGDLLSSKSAASSPWGPLRTLELYHLDRFEMSLPNGGLWGQSQLSNRPDLAHLASLPAQVNLSCGGRFTFDFTKSQATLVNGVHLVHQLGSLAPDEFQSQEVLLHIEPPGKLHTGSTLSQRAMPTPKLRGVQLKLLEATGVDSLENFVGEQKVELTAPTLGAFASAKRLRIDLIENRIELDGKLNRPGATQSTAWLKYMGYEFSAPRIDYDRDGKALVGNMAAAEMPQHLGYLLASGAGEMRAPAESSTGQSTIRWQNSLEMRPTEIPGQQWFGLFGNVLVESELHGYLACDELELWMHDAAGLSDTPNSLPARPLGKEFGQAQLRPDRIRANGQVAISTPQIRAEVNEMTLAFNFVEAPAPATSPTAGPQLADAAGRPMYQWLTSPSNSQPSVPATGSLARLPSASLVVQGSPAASAPPDRLQTAKPMTVLGRALHSTVIVAGDQSWVDNLKVVGPLQVAGETSGPSMPGWNVTGDELQLATNPSGQVDLQITGQPAKIKLAEGFLQGPSIRFDQASNLIWMDQPGEFTIPPSALAGAPGMGASTLNWFEPPHCSWRGRMIFDGQIVRIEGEIQFDGAVAIDGNQFWWIQGQAEVMQLELAGTVDLNQMQSQIASPAKITISQNVNILASQLDSAGTKRSRQQLTLPTLTFDLQSHELIGLGPGAIRSWHVMQTPLPSTVSRTQASNTLNLQGAHLAFRESMRGFLDRKEIYFQGKVELGAGPLATWDESIDLATMQRLTLNQIHLDCDLLKVYDTSGLSSTFNQGSSGSPANKAWEFVAKGNVLFAGKAESGDYEGDGSELSYVQSKELLTLLGEPRRPAHVIIRPLDLQQASVINASVEFAAINPRIPSLESYKMGEQGINVQLRDPANPQNVPSAPAGPIPNPRGTVTDFLRK